VGGASGLRERTTCKVRSEQVCSGIGGAVQNCVFGLSHLATTTSLMEARVTTATRRLRRTGVAGFAAAVTAGAMLIGTATNAFAGELAVTDHVAATTATTVFPGQTAQAVGNLQVNVPNAFHIGDTLTVTLAGGAGCGITNGAVGFAVAPTVAATGPTVGTFGTGAAGNAADITPTFTSAISSVSAACITAGVKDTLTLTFTNSSNVTAPGDNYLVTVSGQTVNVGSAATVGAVNETPAGVGASAAAVATVSNTKAAITEVSSPPSSTATLNTLTLTEVTAGALLPTGAHNIVLTPAGGTGATGTFVTTVTPTVTVSAGYTVGTIVVAAGTITIPVTTPATAVAAVVTVAGIQVLVGATTGVLDLTATTGTVWGSAQPAIGVLNQFRTGGTDRYATAGQLFAAGGFAGGNNKVAVIASGANYPDALSANYLAAGLNPNGAGTRVLLTDPNVLPQPTSQALITGAITTVYVVGGTAAVSTNVTNAIAAMHVGNNNAAAFINVIRVAGSDRYATNNQVDLFNGAVAGVNTAIVAVGSNFADALSVAPTVVSKKYPLVLTNGPSLSASAQSTLVNLGIKNVIIVGGTSAVSAATEASIKALGITIAYRIAGADRTVTAQMIATWETTTAGTQAFAATTAYALLNGLGFSKAAVDVARGDGFADALAAGTVAGAVVAGTVAPIVANAIPILLTGDPNTLGAGIPAYLSGKASTILGTVTILGLTSAVSVATTNAVIASIS
jgi:putative cell wall-binding protein